MGAVHIAANLRERNKKCDCMQRKICNSLNGRRAQSDFPSLTVSIKVSNVNLMPIEMPHNAQAISKQQQLHKSS